MKFRITSEFGIMEEVREGAHTGIDLAMNTGTELRSIQDGVIEKVLHLKDNVGNGVLIKFDDGTTGVYGHLSKINVAEGQHVEAGQLIGFSGNSGASTGPHLHFGLKDANGEFVDPTPVIEQVDAMAGGMSLMDKFNGFADKVIMQEYGILLKPLLGLLGELFTDLGRWFIVNLPDIMGYTTIGAGIFIVLGAMVGKGGIMKPLAYWFGALILAVCILGGV